MVFRTCQAYLVTILIPMCQVLIIPNRRMLTCRSEHLLTHSVTVGRSIALWEGCFQESTKESGPSLLTFITDHVYWPSYPTLLIDLHKWPWLFDLYNMTFITDPDFSPQLLIHTLTNDPGQWPWHLIRITYSVYRMKSKLLMDRNIGKKLTTVLLVFQTGNCKTPIYKNQRLISKSS